MSARLYCFPLPGGVVLAFPTHALALAARERTAGAGDVFVARTLTPLASAEDAWREALALEGTAQHVTAHAEFKRASGALNTRDALALSAFVASNEDTYERDGVGTYGAAAADDDDEDGYEDDGENSEDSEVYDGPADYARWFKKDDATWGLLVPGHVPCKPGVTVYVRTAAGKVSQEVIGKVLGPDKRGRTVAIPVVKTGGR